jgi:hypothetical protein
VFVRPLGSALHRRRRRAAGSRACLPNQTPVNLWEGRALIGEAVPFTNSVYHRMTADFVCLNT